MKIAVTGGLGSGKSTVSKLLASSLECELIDTDQLCRNLLQPGAEGLRELRKVFGGRFLNADGTLDRQGLREATFRDREVKSQLEALLHPLIHETVNDRWNNRQEETGHLVVEVPLLYEVGWQNEFDKSVVVYVPEQLVYKRVALRNGLGAEEVRSILDAQMPIEEKRIYTPFIVDNSSTLVSAVLQVSHLLRKLFLFS